MLFIQYLLVISTCAQNLLELGGSPKGRNSRFSIAEKGKSIATDNDGVAADENLYHLFLRRGGNLGGLSIHEKGEEIEAYDKKVAAHKRQFFSPPSSIGRNSDCKGKAVTADNGGVAADTNRYILSPSSIGRNSDRKGKAVTGGNAGRPSIKQEGERVAAYYNEGIAAEIERVAADSDGLAPDRRQIFSFERFASYEMKIHDKAKQFRKMYSLLQSIYFKNFHEGLEKALDEFISAEAKLPNFSGRYSAKDNQRNEILKLLREFKSYRLLIEEDNTFIKKWTNDRLHEARSVVQSNFMNGAPNERTVAVFDGLLPTDLTGVENFLSDPPRLHLKAICEAISLEIYDDKYYFSLISYRNLVITTESPYDFKKQNYKIKLRIGATTEVIEKEVYELGECIKDGILYFKVAIAKATPMKGKADSFDMEYLIAFDEIERDFTKVHSWLYETYVALSFDASLSIQFGSNPEILVNALSLRA